jgi:hypothetical protein
MQLILYWTRATVNYNLWYREYTVLRCLSIGN